jgi:hypothetical protein
MANRQQRSNRETKKPKKEKIKVIAAAPSQKAAAWQPTPGSSGKKNNPTRLREALQVVRRTFFDRVAATASVFCY